MRAKFFVVMMDENEIIFESLVLYVSFKKIL